MNWLNLFYAIGLVIVGLLIFAGLMYLALEHIKIFIAIGIFVVLVWAVYLALSASS